MRCGVLGCTVIKKLRRTTETVYLYELYAAASSACCSCAEIYVQTRSLERPTLVQYLILRSDSIHLLAVLQMGVT